MRFGYFPGPEMNWLQRPERRPARQAPRNNSPRAVLREMAVTFGLSLAVVLVIDAIVLLVEYPLSAIHLG